MQRHAEAISNESTNLRICTGFCQCPLFLGLFCERAKKEISEKIQTLLCTIDTYVQVQAMQLYNNVVFILVFATKCICTSLRTILHIVLYSSDMHLKFHLTNTKRQNGTFQSSIETETTYICQLFSSWMVD